jgi:CspA family cold shock protein
MSSNNDTVTSSATEHLTGRVKWFNNKAGYGFVTVTDGGRSGTDVFVHHSAINVDSQQYKYLVQGEYVEFDLIRVESDKHEWQASRVSGIRSGKLMCETRHDLKIARNEYKAVKTTDNEEIKMPRQKTFTQDVRGKTSVPRVRGEGPRDGENKKDWTLVGKNTKQRNTQNSRVKTNQSSTIITIQSK